jgi:hypothetical protein
LQRRLKLAYSTNSSVVLQLWLVVTTNEDKARIEQGLGAGTYRVEVFSVTDVGSELEKLASTGA